MKANVCSLAAIGLIAASMHAHASVIDTTGSHNSVIFSFGEPDTATYGQTFLVGADNQLDSFTFFLDDRLDLDFVDFRAYVMAWDGSKAAGGVLFQSGPLSTTNNGGADGFEQFTINTGGLLLTSGQSYVAFFNASTEFDGSGGVAGWASVSGASAYAGGQFVHLNNGSDFGPVTTLDWQQGYQCAGCDLSFRMEFSAAAVPQPATIGLLGVGLGALGFARRRRR